MQEALSAAREFESRSYYPQWTTLDYAESKEAMEANLFFRHGYDFHSWNKRHEDYSHCTSCICSAQLSSSIVHANETSIHTGWSFRHWFAQKHGEHEAITSNQDDVLHTGNDLSAQSTATFDVDSMKHSHSASCSHVLLLSPLILDAVALLNCEAFLSSGFW